MCGVGVGCGVLVVAACACLMSVFWACVCVCVCGGWCVLAAVVVLVGVRRGPEGRYTAHPVSMSRAPRSRHVYRCRLSRAQNQDIDHVVLGLSFGVGPAMRCRFGRAVTRACTISNVGLQAQPWHA